MSLLYKPDWDETKQRYEAWWAHEYFGRCAIAVIAPRSDVAPKEPPRLPDRVEDRWLDFDYLRASNEYRLSRTYYGGEALPIWNPGYPGCDSIAAFLGCPITLDEATGWVDPLFAHGSLEEVDYESLKIADDNRWWRFARDVTAFAVEESRGKALVGCQAIGGCGDTLAWLRGSGNLLLDVMDCPERVREIDQHLMRMWIEVYSTLYGIFRDVTQGSTCWFTLWSPGKFYAAQNDFAYMISPQMYRELFLPSIQMQTEFLDHCVYHVDGIGNFAHVDTLLELPRLQAIQILPGSGKPSPLHYMDVLKKVQAAGKNLHIGIPAHEVEAALEQLSARGLFIQTYAASEEEARALLANVEKWSVDR